MKPDFEKLMLSNLFAESAHSYREILDLYPEKPLDKNDTRRQAVLLNIFALTVIDMSRDNWSKELMQSKFDLYWGVGQELNDLNDDQDLDL